MTQLRRDAAYIRRDTRHHTAAQLSEFDEEVYDLLSTAHTVKSVAKTLAQSGGDRGAPESDLEARVADSMHHLLEAERIELSPDS